MVHSSNGYKGGCRCTECRVKHNAHHLAYHNSHKNDPRYMAMRRRASREWAQRKRVDPKVKERERVTTRQRSRIRLAMIHNIKLKRGCMDCGYNLHPAALEFDHVRGVKLKNVSKTALSSLEAIRLEIEKCEVVCSNCHRIRTYERAQKTKVAV